jgi:sugar O-acyltransferase (sialic acid O-acetyltransferase NeuD family)
VTAAGDTAGQRVHVAGTRTFSAEVIDFAADAGIEVIALLEPFDPDRVGTEIHGRPVIRLETGPGGAPSDVLLGTGETDRRETVARLTAAGWTPRALVHPGAHLAPSSRVGPGAIVGPGAVVGACARIGEACVVGRGALVGHHTELGPFSTLGPGANVAGNVQLGVGAFVGMGAAVRDHLSVGAGAVIAMGAVVVADVAPRVEVRGVPARPRAG